MFWYPYRKFKKVYFSHNLYALLFCLIGLNAISQKKDNTNLEITPIEIWESGLPYIKNYSPGDYKGSPQNWVSIEGNDGFMYVGNTYGILQYDGTTWNMIKLENKSIVRSLAKATGKKIYVGGVHELGYLEPNELGEMQFHSLLANIKANNREFDDVWQTIVIGTNVFFLCEKYLFRWDGKKFKTWEPKEKFGRAFRVDNTLYIESKGVGIHTVDGDLLRLIPGGDVLKNEKGRIDAMLPYQNNKILLAHSYQGLLLYDGKSITSMNKSNNGIFQKHRIYKGITLSNGDYAMATLTSGLYIMDGKTGEIKKRLGKKQGLLSDVVFSIYEDNYGNLWAGSEKGISKIDWKSPFRIFNELSGLGERIRSISYQNHKLLVDSKGLYQLVKGNSYEEKNEPTFKKIEGTETSIKFMIPFNDDILAFDLERIYKINAKSNNAQLIKRQQWTLTSLLKSTIDSSKIYAGTIDGELFECSLLENKWLVKPLLQIDGGIESIVEEPDGNLWLQTFYKGLYFAKNISDNRNKQSKFNIKKYNTLSGLPSMTYNYPYLIDDKLFVTSENDGMYTFNKLEQRFVKDTLLNSQYDKTVDAYGYIGLATDGKIWQTVRAGFENKVYTLSENKLSELQEYNLYADFDTYSMEFLDDVILFLGPKGILAYNQNHIKFSSNDLSTKLRKVWVNNDSLVYSGSNRYKTKEDNFEIPFKNNTLKFEYTLPFYSKSENNTHQYYLEGFDANWSSWSSETKKDYTNIPEGDYSFKVRSKNVFNQISIEDSYSFTVLPPWYRTWWMYFIYGFGAIALVVFISRLWSKQLRKKNKALKVIVEKRTSEILQKNHTLEQQSEQLKLADMVKTQSYANISHEFRTPLTLINGLSKVLIEEGFSEENVKKLESINHSGNQLLHLVNQMLELVSFDAKKVDVSYKNADIIQFIEKCVSFYSFYADSKEVQLNFSSEITSLQMDFDDDKLQKILNNILSNAIKFTSINGAVTLNIAAKNKHLLITITDTGQGIAPEHLPHIFERYYKTFDKDNNLGSGIGMALTKELATILEGTVSVESTLEKGSIFIVKLPIKNTIKASKDIVHQIPFIENSKTETVEEYVENENTTATILLVEDNKEIQDFIKLLLGNLYTMHIANNGVEGLIIAKNESIDFIISDVMMPKMDGFEFCKHIKNDVETSHIPFIIVSAKTTTQDKLQGYKLGIDAYLFKPFDKDELQLVIKNLLHKKAVQRNYFSTLLGLKKQATEVLDINKLDIDFIKTVQEIALSPTKISVDQIAKKLTVSRTQLHKKVTALTGKPITHYINYIRIEKAKKLLKESDLQINEIAFELGFESANYFTRIFKKETGKTPIRYREKPLF